MFELTDCPVPAANLLGEEGNGFRIAMGTLVSGRISVAAGCLGVIEDCLAEAATYAKERHQHGKAIARHQLVQEHIAGIEMDRVATEALVVRAAEAKDASHAEPGNAELRSKADLLAAQAKLFAANAAWTQRIGRYKSSAAAAGPRCTGRGGTCRTCACAASTRGRTRS